MKGLTKKQRQILDFIEDFQMEHGMSPTVYEIGDYMSITAPTVFTHLKALGRKNFIRRTSKARSLVVLESYSKFRKAPRAQVHTVPIFEPLTSSAGEKLDISEHKGGFVFVDKNFFPLSEGQSFFALKIKNDAMAQAGIFNGDIAIFKTGQKAVPSSIVAIFARGEGAVGLFLPNYSDKLAEISESGKNAKSRTYSLNELKICGVFAGLIGFSRRSS